MATQKALLLLDGLDEAGKERDRIEAHVDTVLAKQGHVVLCTSRPAGLGEARFCDFHKLTLSPLSDAQQEAFLAKRLGDARAAELVPYMRDKVPLDAATGKRVTTNPLMLAMVASIAKLHQGIEMPSTAAALYDVATRAMLKRSSAEKKLSHEAETLLGATFLEAHVAQQRIITEEHLGAAAQRCGSGREAVDELTQLVTADQLPLLRLDQSKPLQMKAFHLSIQEYYAMRAITNRTVRLEGFKWDAWWTNVVFMGTQAGDEFGKGLVYAAGLVDAESSNVDNWRSLLLHALVHEGLPTGWLPTAVEAAGGSASDVPRLRAFVGRYRDVIQREGGRAIAQLALQQPQEGVVFDRLREMKMQRLLTWRNKPQADPCVATFAHGSSVSAVAVSRMRIVGAAGKAVHVYDTATEEELGTLEGPSDVKSVAIFETDDEESTALIVAGFENGTIKVWDAGARFRQLPCRLSSPLTPFLLASQILWNSRQPKRAPTATRHASVAFSPDGKTIVSGSWDKTIKVWDAGQPFHLLPCHLSCASDALLACFSDTLELKASKESAHNREIMSVAFSPDGSRRSSLDRMTRRSKCGTQVSRFSFCHLVFLRF